MVSPTAVTEQAVAAAPKVLLHDHLDGGVRASTIIEIADQVGYDRLPSSDVNGLSEHVQRGANRLDLVLYLETFAHTVGIMQTPDAIYRVARECAQDLAADNVVYAEVRYAPELHVEQGMSLDEIVDTVQSGFIDGSAGSRLRIVGLLTAIRQAARSLEIAELAVRHRHNGVVGFDIAGAEAGNPPTRHLDAFQYVQRANFHFTIHAGEAYGPPYIWEAIQYCGAERLGHGVRIVDDIDTSDPAAPKLGDLAAFVRDRRIPLEMCPSSNVHTGAASSIETHPIGLLSDLRFRVTINTDNRLMSNTSMTNEVYSCAVAFDWGWLEIQRLAVNAMKSAFISFDERLEIIEDIIKPAYAGLLGA